MKRAAYVLVGLLVIASLAATTYRASLESSIWVDEVYSLVLADHPVQAQWDLSKGDTNPPGFFVLLRLWNRLLASFGLTQSILIARGLGILMWCVVIMVVGLKSRALGGWKLAAVAVAAIASNAMLATIAKDVRAYAGLSLGLLVCLYLLDALAWCRRGAKRGQLILLGLGLGLMATLLSSSHLLAPVAIGCVFVTWLLIYGLAGRADRRRCAVLLAASGLAAIGALPWFQFVPDQMAFLSSGQVDWMTEPTIANLLEVFTRWLCFGRLPPTDGWLVDGLGWLSCTAPLAIGTWMMLRERLEPSAVRLLGAHALLGTFAFVVCTWMLARWSGVEVFHAPRYPTIMSAVWVVGLVYFSFGDMRGGPRRNLVCALGLAPLLVCGAYGQIVAVQSEHANVGVAKAPREKGRPVFLLPFRLMPYFRKEFSGVGAFPSSDLPCRQTPGPATVIDLNPWRSIDAAPDQMLRWLLEKEVRLGNATKRPASAVGRNRDVYEVGEKTLDLNRYCGQGLVSAGARRLEQTEKVAWGLPEDQTDLRSWSFLEVGEGLETRRWATRPTTRVKLHGAIPAGKRTLHLRGYRPPYPTESVDLVVRLIGATDDLLVALGPGPFSIRKNVDVAHEIRNPSMVILHPTWSPSTFGSSEDTRILSFQLVETWIE